MTNLPVAIIYLPWVGVTLLQPTASIPSSFMRSSYLDFVLAQLTSWTRQKFERHWGILPSQRVLSLHVSSAHLCWSLLKWGSCLSSLLVVPPWTGHLCRPYQTASDSLAIPAHTRWPNMAKQRNGVSEIICCAERDEKERVKSQHDSKLDCKLDWRAPDDELSLGWPELLESAFPILPAPCCSLQKKSQPCKASHLCTWCGDRNSCDHKKWQNFRLFIAVLI